MTTGFPREASHVSMQVFTTSRVQAVEAGVAWTPGANDRAFSSPTDVNLIITDSTPTAQDEIPLAMNVPRGILPGYTYKFDASGSVEVM
jgi:hypothetical protein